MSFKFYRAYLFLIIILLIASCGSFTNQPKSTIIVKENKSKKDSIPEVELDGNEYKIDGKQVKRVDRICISVENLLGDHTVRKLGTNEYLYKINGEFVIGPANSCRCMPNTARILSSRGEIQIDNIQIGDSVYTFNYFHGKIMEPIIQVNKILVQKDYIMTKITLEDGRCIQASPKHPIPIEKDYLNSSKTQYEELLFSEIKIGDYVDNSRVSSIELVNYNGGFTYDILPAGESGYYWADGILVGSTLYNNYISNKIYK